MLLFTRGSMGSEVTIDSGAEKQLQKFMSAHTQSLCVVCYGCTAPTSYHPSTVLQASRRLGRQSPLSKG